MVKLRGCATTQPAFWWDAGSTAALSSGSQNSARPAGPPPRAPFWYMVGTWFDLFTPAPLGPARYKPGTPGSTVAHVPPASTNAAKPGSPAGCAAPCFQPAGLALNSLSAAEPSPSLS